MSGLSEIQLSKNGKRRAEKVPERSLAPPGFKERVERALVGVSRQAIFDGKKVSKSSLQRALKGLKLRGSTLIAFAEALNVRAEWLENGTEPMRPSAVLPGYDEAFDRRLRASREDIEKILKTVGYTKGARLTGFVDMMHFGMALRLCMARWAEEPMPASIVEQAAAWVQRASELASMYDGVADQMERSADDDESDAGAH